MKSYAQGILSMLIMLSVCLVSARAGSRDGLVLYYGFDVTTNSYAADLSGHGHVGILQGGAACTSNGIDGAGCFFNGVNDYIEFGGARDLHLTSLTVSAWIKPYSYDPGWPQVIFTTLSSYGNDGGFQLYLNQSKLTFDYRSSMESITAYGTSSFTRDDNNVWAFVAATYSYRGGISTVDFYVDGEHQGRRTGASKPIYYNGQPGYVGINHDSTVFNFCCRREFGGSIDEVRLYNRVLPENEIQALYQEQLASPDVRITEIGFSNDPEGAQDVTEFYAAETLYIRFMDVDLISTTPRTCVSVMLRQPFNRNYSCVLQPQPDGSFTGAIPLKQFSPGPVDILLFGQQRYKSSTILQRASRIRILPPLSGSSR